METNYARECKLYVAETGICGWHTNILEAQGLKRRPVCGGEKIGAQRCMFSEGGAYAGKHPSECPTGKRHLVLVATRNNARDLASEVTASTA